MRWCDSVKRGTAARKRDKLDECWAGQSFKEDTQDDTQGGWPRVVVRVGEKKKGERCFEGVREEKRAGSPMTVQGPVGEKGEIVR